MCVCFVFLGGKVLDFVRKIGTGRSEYGEKLYCIMWHLSTCV
jgi:hypothetical protein